MRRNVRLLAAFNFCLDFRLYAPVAILYFTEVAGTFALGSSVLALTMVAAAALEIPTGMVSDRVGRRGTMVVGALASAISLAVYAAAPSYAWLLLGACLEGFSRACFSGNNEALLYDSLASDREQARFQEQLGRVSAMLQVALAVSAVAGSVLADVSFRLVMWLSVVPQVVGFFIALGVREPPVHEAPEESFAGQLVTATRLFLQNPRLRWLTVASVLGFAFGEASFQFRAAFVALLWPLWAIGLTRVLANIAGALSFHFSGRLIGRLPEPVWLMAGTAYGAVVELVGVGMANRASPAVMSSGSLFYGVSVVSRASLLQREFSDRLRATMGSLQSVAGSIAFAGVSVALGALADRFGPSTALAASAVAMLLTALLYVPLLPKGKKPPAEEQSKRGG